jgi:phosphatidylglycerophosphatase A
MRRFADRVGLAVARVGGVGNAPVASGTAGTVAAIPLWWLLSDLPVAGYAAAAAAVTALAIWSSDVTARVTGIKDPGIVVIDEVAGFLVTMAGHPFGWGRLLAGFFLFRLFDVLKPPPCRQLEKWAGGVGIVADDIAAGLYANLALQLGAWLVARTTGG